MHCQSGGQLLLEGADLRLVYGRRYGLIGKNGVGKTTLLKAMARFDIEGFPRHHRVLHVKQEVQASEESVIQVVMASDVERNSLFQREAELNEEQQSLPDTATSQLQLLLDELRVVHERMDQISVHTAGNKENKSFSTYLTCILACVCFM